MAFTFGFYNSLNGDRRYDAIQMSSIFDGIIRDGIFMHIGASMTVHAGSGMTVTAGIGRAWFNHTWSLNDALLPVTLAQSEILQDRIDLVVLEINSDPTVRANAVKVVKGTPATNPVRPTPIKSLTLNQYPLADIRVNRGVTAINQSNITNRVGTSETPFVTGPLELMDIDALVAQWGDQWNQFYNAQAAYMESTTEALLLAWKQFYSKQTAEIEGQNDFWGKQWNQFYNAQAAYMAGTTEALLLTWHEFYNSQILDITGQNDLWRSQWVNWFNTETANSTTEMANWRNGRETAFDGWFQALQDILDGDIAANLSTEILALRQRMSVVETFKDILADEFKVLHPIGDSGGGYVLDSIGDGIEGQIIFCIKPCGA
jgi:hypothetical protein